MPYRIITSGLSQYISPGGIAVRPFSVQWMDPSTSSQLQLAGQLEQSIVVLKLELLPSLEAFSPTTRKTSIREIAAFIIISTKNKVKQTIK